MLAISGWQVITTSAKQRRLARVSDMLCTVWRERNKYILAHVDVYSGLAFLWAELVCESLKQIGRPYVLTLHSGRLPAFAEHWPGRVQRLLRSASTVTTPSAFLCERMRQYRPDLVLLPNPIDLGAYHFLARTNPKPRLIWLRAFHKIYNPSLAPRVIARLVEEFPDIHLTMVGPDKGDGSLRETERAATELGVAQHISFHGAIHKGDVPLQLNQNDIFINTTNVDNMPVSVIEAMACGLCVVSTNVGGIPNLIMDNREGLLVSPKDADGMARAIRRILNDERLAKQLSHYAREKAGQFDWAGILPQWENLLAKAATDVQK